MPRIPIDKCPAGPAMDAAVAKALGFKVKWEQWADERRPAYLAGAYADKYDGWAEHEDWRQVLPYSADVAAAWKLVEKMQESLGGPWEAFSSELCSGKRLLRGKGDGDAPLFICRAFLRVKGVEYVKAPE